jgi:hypothetical protein
LPIFEFHEPIPKPVCGERPSLPFSTPAFQKKYTRAACGELDKSLVEIYNVNLRKQDFALSPVLPTCKLCNSEIKTVDPPRGAELIILNGTCGSGKSTVAEELMKRYGYAVIDGDCMLQVLRYRLGGRKAEYNSDGALGEIGREIDILAALGYPIVLSHIILPEDWHRYEAMLSKRKVKYSHILNYVLYFLNNPGKMLLKNL